MIRTTIILVLLLIPVFSAYSDPKLNFPPEVQLGDTTLKKKGEGIRKAGWLGIKVYSAALYSNEDIVALKNDGAVILLEYIYKEIVKSDMQRGWKKSIDDNCKQNCTDISEEINEFYNSQSTIKSGDKIKYEFTVDSCNVLKNNNPTFKCKSEKFSKLLLSTFIGSHPPTKALKKSLLGK
ncbi:MAG: chalcone isomerase family protein [Gammaproteobacteria bacterium]|jgi:hypothetical protein